MTAALSLPAQPPAPVLQPRTHFTLDGSQNLEARLEHTCNEVLAEISRVIPPCKFDGLMLGGGYGRGEWGVQTSQTEERPYNDLEFYVCVRGNRFLNQRRFEPVLRELAEALSRRVGIEVEFKAISFHQLRHAAPSMFYYDLVMGHRWLRGDEHFLAECDHHRQAQLIPPSEATRLLLNRCTGLLLARERLGNAALSADDADFVARNLAKAQLAYGDAVLTLLGQYHWSCRQRHQKLIALHRSGDCPWSAEVRRHHAQGVEFKLHPSQPVNSAESLHQRLYELLDFGEKVWLWIETHRLGTDFPSAWAYASSGIDKCPDTHPVRNRLINAHALGLAAALRPAAHRHPRQRLFHALTLLLWPPNRTRLEWVPVLRKALNASAVEPAGLIQAYLALWRKLR